jgi:hypothetical protein
LSSVGSKLRSSVRGYSEVTSVHRRKDERVTGSDGVLGVLTSSTTSVGVTVRHGTEPMLRVTNVLEANNWAIVVNSELSPLSVSSKAIYSSVLLDAEVLTSGIRGEEYTVSC